MFEPVHGSAPTRVGKHTANPCSMILAAKMMLSWLSGQFSDSRCLAAAEAIEESLIATLGRGITVPDFGGRAKTAEVGKAIAEEIMRVEAI